MAPKRSVTPPPTARQVKWRVVAALATLVLGIVWSSALDHRHGSSRIAVTFAALLVISGLCGFVVALLQGVALRK
jgi:hypothetical protein